MKRLLKSILLFISILLLIVILTIFSFTLYYKSIVRVDVQKLHVKALPGQLGKWVNPFIGSGGIPWVCGHNFSGVSLPFGMVRLSPRVVQF